MAVPAFTSRRAMRLLGAGLVVWALLWFGVAAATAQEVSALGALGQTVVKAGAASVSAGKALESVAGVPFVGGRVGSLGSQAVAAGRSAEASGRSSTSTVDVLAVLLGIAIGLIPTVPLLALYLPLRRGWRRDRKAVARAVAQWDGEPGLDDYLARRALAHLSYQEVRVLADEGGAVLDDGTRERLAAAELRRLGLDRGAPRLRSPTRLRERVPR